MSDSAAPALDRAMNAAETVVYAAVALLLVAGACVAVVSVAHDLVTGLDDGARNAVRDALDGLLLVFIVVELLGAVRATVSERKLVAEPFLIVGIIASIKEIVLAALKAGEVHGDAFDDAMLQVGMLGAVVVALAVACLLVRRKEREPAEE